MTANAIAWGIARDRLPQMGAMVYFSLRDECQARRGCFDKRGFNDVASGNYYAPHSVESWLVRRRQEQLAV